MLLAYVGPEKQQKPIDVFWAAMRVFLIVIDSFGIGEMPDAADYGDDGSDTYGHIYEQAGAELNELVSLGLNNIEGVAKAFGNGNYLDSVRSPRAA